MLNDFGFYLWRMFQEHLRNDFFSRFYHVSNVRHLVENIGSLIFNKQAKYNWCELEMLRKYSVRKFHIG